jgi:hypothetical protein
VTEQTNVQKRSKPSDGVEIQFECYDPTQAQARKRKRNSSSKSPRIRNREAHVEFQVPSPEPITISMENTLDQLTFDSLTTFDGLTTFDSLTWLQDDSVFEPLPLVSSTATFDDEPSREDIELQLSLSPPEVTFNPFQLSPSPSLPSPSVSADNRRLLRYCIPLKSSADSR